MNEMVLYKHDALFNKRNNLLIKDNGTLVVLGEFESGKLKWCENSYPLSNKKTHRNKIYQNNYFEYYIKIRGKNWYLDI